MARAQQKVPAPRFGASTWYGVDALSATRERRAELALVAETGLPMTCPYMTSFFGAQRQCNKAGGVCCIRAVTAEGGPAGAETSVCPGRFYEKSVAFSDIAAHVLGADDPVVTREVDFLTGHTGAAVGNIDAVIYSASDHKRWCAVEMQAVYFSGDEMGVEFGPLGASDRYPFPCGKRRPDFRSSGAKRLLPQLMTKGEMLRRWGKKIAVIVDSEFYRSLGPHPDGAVDVSQGDIVWTIVDYTGAGNSLRVAKRLTLTLEQCITWLTGGTPKTLAAFEAQFAAKQGIRLREP